MLLIFEPISDERKILLTNSMRLVFKEGTSVENLAVSLELAYPTHPALHVNLTFVVQEAVFGLVECSQSR